MTCIGLPAWNKEFAFVENGSLSRGSSYGDRKDLDLIALNLFQRIARTYFGWYANTHLNVVGPAARRALLEPSYNWSERSKGDILEIAQKANPITYLEYENFFLGEEMLGTDVVKYEASFDYAWLVNKDCLFGIDKSKRRLDNLSFKITLNHEGEENRVKVQVCKYGTDIHLTMIDPEISEESEKDRLLARVTSSFLRTLVSTTYCDQLHLREHTYNPFHNGMEKRKWAKMDEYLAPAKAASKITLGTLADDPACRLITPVSIEFMQRLDSARLT